MSSASKNTVPLVTMTGITKDFSGNRVLDGVHFDLAAGEVHVLAGENGAGKSTLIKILGGIHPDHGGSIRLDDRDVKISSPRDAARRGIAVIHQELSLVPSMSVADNLFLGNEYRRRRFFLDRRRQMREARAVLERMGMDIDPSLPVDVFPVSVRQILEIAKALAREARVIIMDEPTSALSNDEAKNLFTVIAGLKQRNCGIIYITHKMEEIFTIADRITVLRDGVCMGTSPRDRIDKRELVKQMVGRELDEQIPLGVPFPGKVRLEVKHLSLPGPRGYGNFQVNDVSFSVRGGETVGFAGLQGSGTSDLFSAVFGACGERARGEVLVDGVPLPRFSIPQAIEKG
ncbi:MAG TPA: sugar ABC transporter ATP-binding protein, partial [Spirochaetes bacterium]|nr:sugar ABC transporter ATP-binding protein [Spirochaetota bacterium]